MGHMFGGSPNMPPPPPPAPNNDNTQAQQDAASRAQIDRTTRGRASTQLTGGEGVSDAGTQYKKAALLGSA